MSNPCPAEPNDIPPIPVLPTRNRPPLPPDEILPESGVMLGISSTPSVASVPSGFPQPTPSPASPVGMLTARDQSVASIPVWVWVTMAITGLLGMAAIVSLLPFSVPKHQRALPGPTTGIATTQRKLPTTSAGPSMRSTKIVQPGSQKSVGELTRPSQVSAFVYESEKSVPTPTAARVWTYQSADKQHHVDVLVVSAGMQTDQVTTLGWRDVRPFGRFVCGIAPGSVPGCVSDLTGPGSLVVMSKTMDVSVLRTFMADLLTRI